MTTPHTRDEYGGIVGINHVGGVISVATVGDSGMTFHNIPWDIEKGGPRNIHLSLDRGAATVAPAATVADDDEAFNPAEQEATGDVPQYVFDAAAAYADDVRSELIDTSLSAPAPVADEPA